MVAHSEDRLQVVTDQLIEEFGDVIPRETIARVVENVRSQFVDVRVALFVPILVRRLARERLRAWTPPRDSVILPECIRAGS